MKSGCEKWKDELLEAALTGASTPELAEHLRNCGDCAAELRVLEARRERLDALLPLVVRGAQPSADFRARVLAATEAASSKHRRMARWRVWTLAAAGAAAAMVLALMVWYRGSEREIPPDEIAAAQRLAEWRAPSDSLLATPGQEILKTTPKLGESYLTVPVNKIEEE